MRQDTLPLRLTPLVPAWARNPYRYCYQELDRVWCRSREQTRWWFESDGYQNYAECEPPAADPLQLAQPILVAAVAPAIEEAVTAAESAAALDAEATEARAHAALVSGRAAVAAEQAHVSATHAAQEIHNLADCFDLSASIRGEQHQAAVIASDSTQACVTGIAQAQAALATDTAQALRGATAEDRGVAWSTIGPAAIDPVVQIATDAPHPPDAGVHEGDTGNGETADDPVPAGIPANVATDHNSDTIAPVACNTVAVVHPTVSITNFLGSFAPPMPVFPFGLNAHCRATSTQRAARMR